MSTLAASMALLVGTLVGLTAGLAGGWVDALLMRGTDVVLAVPRLFLALMLVAISILRFLCGMGWIWVLAAAAGGGFLICHNIRMIRDPSARVAMQSFFASLAQLVILLLSAVVDVLL